MCTGEIWAYIEGGLAFLFVIGIVFAARIWVDHQYARPSHKPDYRYIRWLEEQTSEPLWQTIRRAEWTVNPPPWRQP